jgi:hypothetical protein
MKTLGPVVVALLLSFGVSGQQERSPAVAVPVHTPFSDARPILESLRRELIPAELRDLTPSAAQEKWSEWVTQHDASIRTRLERGDDDSVVNFLLYGTSFTKAPRATERDLAQLGAEPTRLPAMIVRRIDDLVSAAASPGSNERVQFARQVLERGGIDVTRAAGKADARRYLTANLVRMSAEIDSLSERRLNDPSVELVDRLTRFRDRGLSSDTAIFADFAVERTLEAVKADGALAPGSVRRVAIVGPGLDFTDKHEGYDFYPPQTTQPFAAIDTLIRLGLATGGDLRLTTLDLSPRVNLHIATAREQAGRNTGYVAQLPRSLESQWTAELVSYWRRLGDRIGEEVAPAPVPPGVGKVSLRAVRVRPGVVLSITPQDVNIVVQRLEPLAAGERFDLVIATNILAYYDAFEQSLALRNIATMLRPGGLLLTNNGLFELPSTPMQWIGSTDVTYMQVAGVGETIDRLFWYRRE